MRSLHFLYHELRPTRSSYTYVTPCAEFEAHCELFACVRKREAGSIFRPEVTFDDGNISDFVLAAPVLERHGLHGFFFITAAWTERRPAFMNWAQLRDLHAAGHRIGAHGMTHKLLTECPASELREELQGARKRLEDGIGAPIRIMSLPGGRANKHVLYACEEAGYKQVFTSLPRAEAMDQNPNIVGRVNLVSGTTTAWLERVLDPRTGVLKRLERTAELKQLAQRLLGDQLYARLWAIGNRQETQTTNLGAPVP